MALSAKGTKALAEIEVNASILYGQDYFSEEEWIELDRLVHKGRYVWTRGPVEASTSTHSQEINNVQSPPRPVRGIIQTSDYPAVMNESTIPASFNYQYSQPPRMEVELSSTVGMQAPVLSQIPAIVELPQHRRNTPSISEKEAVRRSEAMTASLQTLEPRTTVSSASIPAENHNRAPGALPPGCTQAQLDEVKAFNEWMKSSKGRSARYKSKDANPPLVPESQFATEKESWTHSWAENVAEQKKTLSPSRHPSPPVSVYISPEETAYLAAIYKVRSGRTHASLGDIWQPKNPTFWSNKILSELRQNPPPGTVLLAQAVVHADQNNRLEIRIGDQIEVLKPRNDPKSCHGRNKRTGKPGHFDLAVCKRNGALMLAPAISASATIRPAASNPLPAAIARMDSAERRNAQAWEEEDEESDDDLVAPKKSVPTRTAEGQTEPNNRPLSVSKPRTLADLNEDRLGHERSKKLPLTSANVAAATDPSPRARSSGLRDEPFDLRPKTETCWFWATGKGCRFAADECRDLHAYTANSTGANFHKGKPTWGALADYVPPSEDAQPVSNLAMEPSPTDSDGQVLEHVPSSTHSNTHATSRTTADPGSPALWASKSILTTRPTSPSKLPSHALTCYYWATPGKECRWSDKECKFIHGSSPFGVANQLTCHFWAGTGHCKNSDESCHYLHAWSNAGIAPPPGKKGAIAAKYSGNAWRRPSEDAEQDIDARTWASEVEEEQTAMGDSVGPTPVDETSADAISAVVDTATEDIATEVGKSDQDTITVYSEGHNGYGIQAETAIEIDLSDGDHEVVEAAVSDNQHDPSSGPYNVETTRPVSTGELLQLDAISLDGQKATLVHTEEVHGKTEEAGVDPFISARWEGPGGWDLEEQQEGIAEDSNIITNGW